MLRRKRLFGDEVGIPPSQGGCRVTSIKVLLHLDIITLFLLSRRVLENLPLFIRKCFPPLPGNFGNLSKRRLAAFLLQLLADFCSHTAGKQPERRDRLLGLLLLSHDTQVVNMMHFLQKDFDFTPYASTVFFELKYSTECLASDSADENCFGVSVIFNGRPQLFDGCSGDLFTLEGCKFPEFIDYIGSVWYSGPSAPDLDAACSTVA